MKTTKMEKHKQIANKYIHGHSEALTDDQEAIDLSNEILEFAKNYHERSENKRTITEGRLNRYLIVMYSMASGMMFEYVYRVPSDVWYTPFFIACFWTLYVLIWVFRKKQ